MPRRPIVLFMVVCGLLGGIWVALAHRALATQEGVSGCANPGALGQFVLGHDYNPVYLTIRRHGMMQPRRRPGRIVTDGMSA